MPDDRATSGRRPWLLYTGLRLVVFVGTAGVLAVFGLNGFPLLAAALILSMLVSAVVLRRQRAAAVEAFLARREKRTAEREELRSRLDGL